MGDEFSALRQKVESLNEEANELRCALLSCLDAANNKAQYAIALARSVGETLAKSLVQGIGIKPPGTFDACLRELEKPEVLNRGLVPAQIITLLHKVRTFGNKAIHDDMSVTASSEYVVSVLTDVLLVVSWYLGEFSGGPKLNPVYQLVVPRGPDASEGSAPTGEPASSVGGFGVSTLLLGGVVTGVVAALGAATVVLGRVHALGEMSFMQQSAVAAAFLGLPAIVINRYQVRRLEEVGRIKQRQALDDLTRRLLGRVDTPRLLTPAAVRGLAHGIEQTLGCPVISDKMIIEAIRRAALDLENLCQGSELTRRLTNLNSLLKGIDAEALPLLSIANTDRLLAYIRSQTFLMRVLFATTVILAGVAFGVLPADKSYSAYLGWMVGGAAFAILLVQVMVLVSTSRSIRFWSRSSPRATNPAQLSRVFDFFLIASMARSRAMNWFWNNFWGIIWESGLIMGSGISQRTRNTFLAMHDFRYGVARSSWRRLLAVQVELDGLPAEETARKVTLEEEFVGLCRELWAITGDDLFREIEKRGQILATDMENSTTRVL